MRKETIKPLYLLILLLFTAVLVQAYVIYDLKEENGDKKSQSSPNHLSVSHTPSVGDPFVQMQKIHEQMMKEFENLNSMFANDPFFQDPFAQGRLLPMSDIIEEDKAYILELEIPEVDEQKIEITNEGNIIHISAQGQRSSDSNGTDFIYKESFGHYFKRSLLLPKDADMSSMKNSYKNGVLTITIPKKGS